MSNNESDNAMVPIVESEAASKQIKNEVERVSAEKGLRRFMHKMILQRIDAKTNEEKLLKEFVKFIDDHQELKKIDENLFQQFQIVYRALKSHNEAYERDTTNLTGLKESLQKEDKESLRDSIDRTLTPIKKIDAQADDYAKKANALVKDIDNLQHQMSILNAKSSKYKKLAKEQEKLEKKLSKTEDQLSEAEDSLEDSLRLYPETEQELVAKSIENGKARLAVMNDVVKKILPTLKITVPTPRTPEETSTADVQRKNLLRKSSRRLNPSLRRNQSAPVGNS